jgi:large subunit ribosomal protein L9
MRVYMIKDVEKVGMSGQVVNVSDGFAANYLFPRKLAMPVTSGNMKQIQHVVQKEQVSAQILNSKVAMLAERIKTLHLTVKERVHDDGKLYGAVGADEVVELLKEKDIVINRKQVEFDKAIKAVGEHKVTIRLSSKLKPQLTIKVVSL